MLLEMFAAILLVGAVGGYLGGIVGAGMGATVVPGLILLGIDPVISIGSSLLLHVLIAPLGGIVHYKFGHVRRKIFIPLIIVGVLGTFLGANVSTHLPAGVLKLLIGILAIIAGLLIIVRYPRGNRRKLTIAPISKRLRMVSTSTVATIALIAGLFYGMSGAMWGSIGVPLLILVGVTPHAAIGSSLLARSTVALAGASTYYFLNGVQADIAFPLLTGGSTGILLGAFITKRLSPKMLKLIIGIAVIILGVSVLVKQVI
jgi:hypothetical protein